MRARAGCVCSSAYPNKTNEAMYEYHCCEQQGYYRSCSGLIRVCTHRGSHPCRNTRQKMRNLSESEGARKQERERGGGRGREESTFGATSRTEARLQAGYRKLQCTAVVKQTCCCTPNSHVPGNLRTLKTPGRGGSQKETPCDLLYRRQGYQVSHIGILF